MNRSAQFRWSIPAEAAGPVNGPVTPTVADLQPSALAWWTVLPGFATATDVAAAATPRTMTTPRIAWNFFMPSSLLVALCPSVRRRHGRVGYLRPRRGAAE